MKERVLYFIQYLRHSDWKIKSQAYADFMNFSEPQAVSLFWEALDFKDELLLIYFCRWISKNAFLEGIPYVLKLTEQKSLRVSKEALFSLEKILQNSAVSDRVKIQFLTDLLLQGNEEAQIFSARMFAKYRKKAGGPYLSETLCQSTSPKVRLACVDALRENQDERALPILQKFLGDMDRDVLYAVIFALGDLGPGSVSWKLLRPFLKDFRITIRHVSIWALGRLGGKKAFSALVDILRHDGSPICRIEACKRLSRISSSKIIPVLLETASLDRDQNVKNIAHFCLDKMDPHFSFKKYYKFRKSKELHIRVEVFMQLAKIGHPKAFRYLTSVMRTEKNPQIQAAAVEALGTLEDRRAIPILKEALSRHSVVAYSAMVSLAQLMGSQELPFILETLQNEKTPIMMQQIILKHLLTKAKDKKIFFIQPLINSLIQKLYSADINVSYVSTLILGESHDLSAIVPLFQLSMSTQDPEVKFRALQAIEHLVEGDLSMLVKLLTQPFVTSLLYEEILKMLTRFQCKVHAKRDTLLRLLFLAEKAESPRIIYFLSAIRHITGDDVDILLAILKQTTWSPSLMADLFMMLEGCIQEGDIKNSILPLEPFHRGLKHENSEVRKVSVRILEKISQTNALESLMARVYEDQDPEVSRYAKVAVKTLVNEAL